jgi:hypothetical protein
MMRIDFLHPVFHTGYNSTVRKGIRSINIDDQVELYQTGSDTPVAVGCVTDIIVTQLCTIYMFPELIQYQHDEETQNFHGLLEAMDRAYPGIKPSEIITIIYFYIGD